MLRSSLLTVSHTLHFIFLSLIAEFQRHLGIYYLCRSKSYTAMIYSGTAFKILSQQLFSAHYHSQIGNLALLINYRYLFFLMKKHHEKYEGQFSISLFAFVGAIKIKGCSVKHHSLQLYVFWIFSGLTVHSLQEPKESFVQHFLWTSVCPVQSQLCFNRCGWTL